MLSTPCCASRGRARTLPLGPAALSSEKSTGIRTSVSFMWDWLGAGHCARGMSPIWHDGMSLTNLSSCGWQTEISVWSDGI